MALMPAGTDKLRKYDPRLVMNVEGNIEVSFVCFSKFEDKL